MGKSLMIMGTASSVGKSVITAGLCRIFYRDGVNVSPFKSQNMALNSFITEDGKEMGRAQVVQAEAAGKKPDVLMNPILLKPTSDKIAQVVVNGEVQNILDAETYHNFKPKLKKIVTNCYKELEDKSDLVILEGAGSPAEINLREGDLVNMGMAEISDSPVILVGDIDKGGVFASLYGTIKLLQPEEQRRIKGVIINKFRGDIKLLESGLKMLEDLIKIPVLGVIPWHNIDIEDEDSVSDRFNIKQNSGDVDISVLRLPYMSNYTDFNVLEAREDINLKYINPGESIGSTDVIIIPGSKSVISDLITLKNCGWDEEIYRHNSKGGLIFGICGGYQILGKSIEDPHGVDGNIEKTNGLGLFKNRTVFEKSKKTRQVTGKISVGTEYWKSLNEIQVTGYEIHMGQTISKEENFISISDSEADGSIKDNIIGTYFHGIFDNSTFTSKFINKIRRDKGLEETDKNLDYKTYKEREFDKLAELLRKHLDIKQIKKIIG